MFDALPQASLWLIPGAPLLASVLIALFGPKLLGERSSWLTVASIAVSAVLALGLLFSGVPSAADVHDSSAAAAADEATGGADGEAAHHAGEPVIVSGYQWMKVGDLDVRIDLRADAMTAIMLTMVTVVSLLVAIFAAGYMHGDPGYARFFAEFALFVFSMCMLVLAGNFLMLFIFWEAVGLCSYLLIGFWFAKPSAAAAAKKAFVVNRIGDFGFLIGIFLIWTTFGTLSFDGVFGNAALLEQLASDNPERLLAICLLLFVGAVGKSAQFPLHVWLPDAMEGPTPVSALIHAATMVTAGVYMVARCTPLFVLAPEAQMTVAGIGAITALLAALIALTQNDLKRVLAYSTVSQLGYMFMALGSAAVSPKAATFAITAALFHMFTHAFFKALLFLASGSVMHAMGDVIDMRRFGGLRKALPYTHWTFLIGAAALAGVPVFSGFWSKDEIIAAIAAGTHGGPNETFFTFVLVSAVLTAVLTAFYTFRAYFMTFHGPERFPPEAGHHPHEATPVMAVPLMILAVCAALVGLLLGPTHLFAEYLHQTPGLPAAPESHGFHWDIIAISTLAVVVGIGGAWLLYYRRPEAPAQLRKRLGGAYELSSNLFYLDDLYTAVIVRPMQIFADLCVLFDRYVIDKLVDLFGWVPVVTGRILRPLQDGLMPSYTLTMMAGLAFFLLTMLRAFGAM